MLNEWFGWDNTTSLLVIGGVLVVILVIIFFVQARRTRRSLMGKVLMIHGDVRSNIRTCKKYDKTGIIKRLKTEDWENHRNDVGFLPPDLLTDTEKYFDMVNKINQQIDISANKALDGQTTSVDISGLAQPQQDVNRRLEKWVHTNYYNEKYLPRRKGIFRF
ncbi:MAG: hypothetical protein PVG61_07850 [Dehalococcoidia bacterium]|jgi:hypothetical protein